MAVSRPSKTWGSRRQGSFLAHLMTTLDHLSRGRMAWNVVTSYKREEALNFGYRELLDHDQRYDRADKYMALCSQLWASWEPAAVVMAPHTRPI